MTVVDELFWNSRKRLKQGLERSVEQLLILFLFSLSMGLDNFYEEKSWSKATLKYFKVNVLFVATSISISSLRVATKASYPFVTLLALLTWYFGYTKRKLYFT